MAIMTQYMMHKEKDFIHLQYALNNYVATFFKVSPFSLGDSKLYLFENLDGKILRFTLDDGLGFFSNKDFIDT